MKKLYYLALFISLLAHLRSLAATFTVTSANDIGPGTLRQAITDANTNGVDTIHFNITTPASGVRTIALSTALPAILFPVVIDGYTQPGSSPNTLANGDDAVLLIEIKRVGGPNFSGLVMSGSNSVIRGLVINDFILAGIEIRANNAVVEGCFIGTDPTGRIDRGNSSQGVYFPPSFPAASARIGGTSPGARNVISGNSPGPGIFIQSGSNHVVQGNFIGTDATGTNSLPNATGIILQTTTNNLIGGTNIAARNVICGGNSTGISVQTGTSNRIQGNFIGTDVTGTKSLGVVPGINLASGSSATQVGGLTATPGAPPGNVISANGANGVGIQVNGNDNLIQGNLIGTDATGLNPLGNKSHGLLVLGAFNVISNNVIAACVGRGISMGTPAHDNLIDGNFIGTDITGTNVLGNGFGGVNMEGVNITTSFNNAIRGNRITGSVGHGIVIAGLNSTNNLISSNSIFANTRLAIDLTGGTENSTTRVTSNDAGDADNGNNRLQNFPVLSGVALGGGNVTLSGTLNSATNASFRLEFFSNAACDGTGNGEGETFLGFTNVTTDGSGDAAFAVTLPLVGGAVFAATATDTDGNTSEFSPCASVPGPCTILCPANIVVSTPPDQCGARVFFSPTTSGNCGAVNCSPASGSLFPKGTTTVTCTTASGTNCSFTISVNDTIAPTITCPANIATNVPSGQTSAVVNYPAPVVTDSCPGVTTNCVPASGSVFPLGVTTVTCTATDTSGNTNTCSFTVTVSAVNGAPTLTAPANLTILENAGATNVTLTGISAGPASDLGQTLTVTATSSNPGLIQNPNVTYTSPNATGVLSFAPVANAIGSATITVVVQDDGGTANGGVAAVTNIFTVTVNSVNVAPVLTMPPTQTIDELTALNVNATATDANVPTDTLTFALVSGPSGLTVSSSGAIAWTPTEADGPSANNVTVRVFDNGSPSLSHAQSFSVIVNEVNLAPVLTVPPTQTIDELTPLNVNATATDADVPANALTFALVSGPTGLKVSTSGAVAWTPTASQGPSTNIVTVRVSDNGSPSLSMAQSFIVVVNAGTNQGRTLAWFKIAGGGGSGTAGTRTLAGTIGQPDAGGPLTNSQFSLVGGFWALPVAFQMAGAPTLTIIPSASGQATISWTPATAGFVLQESLSLSPAVWTDSPSGATNRIVVPATLPRKFYRLFKP